MSEPVRKKIPIPLLAALSAIGLLVTYANHFENGFRFDDFHTIVQNGSIRSLENVPRFFTDISTFGTMPGNRGYRPVVTLLNALDYAMAGGLEPIVFHVSIFCSYLLLGVLLYFFTLRLYRRVLDGPLLPLTALLTTAFYMFHTANAETVNYIIARSDSFSTLCIVATLFLFQMEKFRRFQLHLVPLLVGLFTKEVTLMVVPLLFLYSLYFEQSFLLGEMLAREGWVKLFRAFLGALSSAVLGVAVTLLNLLYMTDPARLSSGLAHPRLDYFSSQFIVVAHYLRNFVLPTDLSADPDFKVTPEFFTGQKMACLGIIVALHLVALYCATKSRYLPISFGILWFFITLIPTSTINPLYQVANDHRTFLPYIGLSLALGWWVYLLNLLRPSKFWLVLVLCVLLGHAYGVRQRNQVWSSAEALWGDAVKKSPENGRAQMNYGLALMERGEFDGAQYHFQRAMELRPTWPFIHINMAILKGARGDDRAAEEYFKKALDYGNASPEPYYFYARWLAQKGRSDDARKLAAKALELSPDHTQVQSLLAELHRSADDRLKEAEARVQDEPTVDNFLELSLQRYRNGNYEGCIAACEEALRLDPDNALAYNNICTSYNSLKQWDKAIAAGEKAVKLKPDFELARNNLKFARDSNK